MPPEHADTLEDELMIDLEIPKKFAQVTGLAQQAAEHVFRPVSRQYDREEHTYPKELDAFAAALGKLELTLEELLASPALGVKFHVVSMFEFKT